jgi:tetratricopeptide (TPR) repeat protein
MRRRRARAAGAAALLLALAACMPPGEGAPEAPGAPAEAAAPPVAEAAPARRGPRRDPEADRRLAETRRGLGLALEAAGDIEAAVSEFEAALAAAPWTGPLADSPRGDLARICRRAEPPAAVARACGAAIRSLRFAPAEVAEFLANRGDANARRGRADLAVRDYAEALEIRSDQPRALLGRARLRIAEGRPALALNDLRLAIATAPRPAEARLERARAYMALGAPEQAVADYDAVLADAGAAPFHPAAWRGRAGAHCALGRADAAAVDWQVWADSRPDGPGWLAELLRARGYLKGPWEPGIGPATLAALKAWTGAGCP